MFLGAQASPLLRLSPPFVGCHCQADEPSSWASDLHLVALLPQYHRARIPLGATWGQTACLAVTLSLSSAQATTVPLGYLESPIGFWKSILAIIQFSGHLARLLVSRWPLRASILCIFVSPRIYFRVGLTV